MSASLIPPEKIRLALQKALNNPLFGFFLGQAQSTQFDNLFACDFADRRFMNQRSVNMSGKQFRRGIDFAGPNQNCVTFGMASTAVVAQNPGMILLPGIALGH